MPATKSKSNGDSTVKVPSQNLSDGVAVAASPKKSKTEIVKPPKVLRADLAEQKKKYEAEDWHFTNVGIIWTAKNGSPAFPDFEAVNLSNILEQIDAWKAENASGLEKFIEEKNKSAEGEKDSFWNLIAHKLRIQIRDFAAANEITFLYPTESGKHVEIEYADKKKNVLTSVFFDESGQKYTKRRPEFGANVFHEGITIETFFEKFPESAEPSPSQTELHRRAVKTAEYENLIGDVLIGYETHNRVLDELKQKFGDAWYDAFDRLSKSEFRQTVKELWLGDCDGSEDDLTDEFRSARVDAVLAPNVSENSVVNLSTGEISVSEFTPQLHRRRRFQPQDLTELAESIKQQGLINPITVRPRDWVPHLNEFGRYGAMLHKNRPDWVLVHIGAKTEADAQIWCDAHKYEIVAGERRFEASKLAGLSTILCVVKDLTDEQALEIQLQENLQRVDVNPLDEAFSYKYLMDEKKMSVADLMVKFGKSEKYVTLRLKLNNLIPEVLDVVSSGQLPLGHAVEISKFDADRQSEALKCCFETSWSAKGYLPDYNKPLHLKSVLKNIASKVLHNLKGAPFPIKDKRLRADGLICPNCPERTGANDPMSLFEEYREEGADRCLNAACYQAKTTRFVQIKRDEATKKVKKELNCADDYQIRVLAWNSSNKPVLKAIFGDGVLSDGEYKNLYGNPCKSAQPGVFLDPGSHRFGEVIQICIDKNCTKHRSASSSASASGEKTDKEKAAFYERKQEIFDVKVGEAVRRQTLAAAAQVFNGEKWIFDDKTWRVRLVERLWGCTDDNAHRVVEAALGREKYSISPGYSDSERIQYFNEKFTSDELSRVLFLLIVANDGEMLYGNWKNQKPVVAVAEEFGVDYAMLDAKERVAVAPKKFQDAAKQHLGKIEAGEKAARPVFYKLEK